MKVALCTPVYDGRAHAAYYRGVTDIQRVLSRAGIETAYMDAGHSANLPRLRNALAAKALHWGADAILWIDSDIAGNGEDALRLVHSCKDIIGAAPQRRPLSLSDPVSVAFRPLDDGRIGIEGNLVEVGGVATAFCLMRRAVFKKMRDEGIAKRLVNRDGPANEWFCNFFWYELTQTAEGWLDDGEDFYLCRKAIELGFKCYIEPNIRPIHHEGRMRLPANFMDVYGNALSDQDQG